MPRCRAFVCLLAIPLLGCVPVHPVTSAGAPVTAAPSTAPPASPASSGASVQDAAQPVFETKVLPIIFERCRPCHFQGGTMYARLPFDQPGTIRVLGTSLFTRIRDEEERQTIRDFLGVPAPAPGEAPGDESDPR